MVVNYLDVGRARSVRPLKADSPLAVYADRVLPYSLSSQRLQAIAAQCSQRVQGGRGVQYGQPPGRLPLESLERGDVLSDSEPFCVPVSVAKYQYGEL